MIYIQRFTFNMVEAHSYVLSDDSREAVIIDDGAYTQEESQAVARYIADKHLRPVRSLVTHAHFDHVWGTAFLYENYGLKTDLHADDAYLYDHFEEQMQFFFRTNLPLRPAPAGKLLHEGDSIHFGHHQLTVISTPGHTPGGICFYCAEEGILFSGDSLFRRSIGRTDFPGADLKALTRSLKEKILTLPASTKVYPGHGESTAIGEECAENPYLMD